MLYSQSPALLLAWLLWCLLHSLLASRRLTKILTTRAGLRQRYYRLYYVIFSTASLGLLLAWQFTVLNLPAPADWTWQGCRLLLGGYGFFMFWAGSRTYDLRKFLGLDDFTGGPRPLTTPFRRDGILGRVRHPWYSGGIALVFALGQTPLDRLDWRLLLIVYLVAGAWLEERRLLAELGEVYRRYRQEVPMLLPRLGGK